MIEVKVHGKTLPNSTFVDADTAPLLAGKKLYAKPNGYIYFQDRSGDKAVNVYLHRFIAGAEKGMDVDHINGVRHDNRTENLRVCTRSQNMANMGRERRGVMKTRDGKRWVARICIDYKTRHIGTFDTYREAVTAYQACAEDYFGGFSVHLRGKAAK